MSFSTNVLAADQYFSSVSNSTSQTLLRSISLQGYKSAGIYEIDATWGTDGYVDNALGQNSLLRVTAVIDRNAATDITVRETLSLGHLGHSATSGWILDMHFNYVFVVRSDFETGSGSVVITVTDSSVSDNPLVHRSASLKRIG